MDLVNSTGTAREFRFYDLSNVSNVADVHSDSTFVASLAVWYCLMLQIVFCTSMGLLGLVSNVLNICVFIKQGLNTSLNISFFAMSVSDFIRIVLVHWMNFCNAPGVEDLGAPFVFSDITYLAAGWPVGCANRITMFITGYITAERCLCIAAPLKIQRIVTPFRTMVILVTIDVCNVLALVPEYVSVYYDWNFYPARNKTLLGLAFRVGAAGETQFVTFTLHAVLMTLALTFVAISTAVLVFQLKAKSRWRRENTRDSDQQKSISNRDRKTVKLVILVATVMVACYAPAVVLSLLSSLWPDFSFTGSLSDLFRSCWSLVYIFSVVNASVNIFIYYSMSSRYKEGLDRLLNRIKMPGIEWKVLKLLITALFLKYEPSSASVCSSTHLECNARIPWNRSMSAREFHLSYCPYRCREGRLVTINSLPQYCPMFSCFQCSCKRPECEPYDICCPDFSETRFELPGLATVVEAIDDKEIFWVNNAKNVTGVEANSTSNYSVEFPAQGARNRTPVLGCQRYDAIRSFLYVRSCRGRYNVSDEVAGKCELNILNSDVTVDNYVYVEDVGTGRCTGTGTSHTNTTDPIDEKPYLGYPRPVELTVHCNDYMTMYTITDPDAMLRAARKSNCCSVTRGFPRGVKTFTCDTKLFSTSVVGSCDVTSSSSEYDVDVVQACKELNNNYYRALSIPKMNYYTNIFCGMCHENTSVCFNDSCACSRGILPPQSPPFSVLIDFGRQSKPSPPTETPLFAQSNCSAAEWSTPDSKCLPLNCSPGKLLNTTCVTAFTYVRGLQYNLRLWLMASGVANDINTVNLTDLNNGITSRMFKKFMILANSLGTVLTLRSMSVWTADHSSADQSPVQLIMCWVEMTIIANASLSRDEFETIMIDRFITTDLEVDTGHNQMDHFRTASFFSLLFSEEYCAIISNTSKHAKCIQNTFNTGNKKPFPCNYRRNGNVNISMTLLCSYLTFNSTDYHITVNFTAMPPKVTVTINLNVTKVDFWEVADLNMMELRSDGSLNICRELLDKRLRDMEEDHSRRSVLTHDEGLIGFSQYVLTIVCLGISQFCLLITVYTFCRFKVLRNTAGKFNMCLSLSLLLAQVFLLAGSHRFGPEILCQAVGVLTHFFWLWMFTWTFICSFRMAKIFTSPMASGGVSTREQDVAFLRTAAASLGFPAAVVVLTVVTSFITSGYPGYGRMSCYLDSVLTIGKLV
ncbi:hypothetical protein Btru_025063 [Bulinus truncatus]|nr:hypothetical protein Btru_025063 [Bulinus truncatus]